MSIYFLENAPTKTEKPAIFLKIRENDDLESKTQKLEIVICFFFNFNRWSKNTEYFLLL